MIKERLGKLQARKRARLSAAKDCLHGVGKKQAQTMSVLREKTAMNAELQSLKDRFADMAKEMAARGAALDRSIHPRAASALPYLAGENTQAAESMRQSIDSLQKMTYVAHAVLCAPCSVALPF